MTFKEWFTEKNGFELKNLIKALRKEGYSQYKNKIPNRMHEYTNGDIIISMGTSNNGKSMDIFKVRTDDKKDDTKIEPKSLEHFTKIIRSRSVNDATSK